MAVASRYHSCNKCSFKTTLLSRIGEHLLSHTTTSSNPFTCWNELKPLKCTSCTYTCQTLVQLRYHFFCQHHEAIKPLKETLKECEKCNFKTYSDLLWIRHRKLGGTCKNVIKIKYRKKVYANPKKAQCKKCSYRTESRASLQIHIIHRHTPLDKVQWHVCNVCDAKFKVKSALKLHSRHHLSNEEKEKFLLYCPQCDYKSFARADLIKHTNRKHLPLDEIAWVECYDCGAKFKDKELLRTHVKIHSAVRENRFKCTKCDFMTTHSYILKVHEVNKHMKDDEIQWTYCQHCEYRAKQKYSVVKHTRLMHSKDVEWKQCTHCDFKTKRMNNLDMHMIRFHCDKGGLKCTMCSYRCKYQTQMETHKKNIHEIGDVEWLKCDHCDFSSKYKHNLKNHIDCKHSKEQKYVCDKCDYKTASLMYFKEHKRKIHATMTKLTLELQCEHCPFVTSKRKNLNDHMKARHVERTKENMLKCAHCKYVCFYKRNLISHLKNKHDFGMNIKWYNCDQCDYKNKQKNCLDRHMDTNHNKGPLIQCDMCSYKTGYEGAMRKHKKVHDKRGPITISSEFECYDCGHKTNKKINIYKHITRTHLKNRIKKQEY